jgi:arylsulfatase
MRSILPVLLVLALGAIGPAPTGAREIVHDAEYYILEAQNAEKWEAEDKEIGKKLADLKQKHSQPPNIVYILWDDSAFGAVGFPGLQKNFGYETPEINKMAAEGINFTRMYSEPACTPTRAAVLTGRHPVRNGMGVVGMPHEYGGLRADEVTIAEVLSDAGYATAHFGKGHLGDIEESYLHNQGFDEALFTPMNQLISLWNPMANAANAVLGLHPEIYPPDPYRLDSPGLLPEGWVMIIEGKKGEQGKEWCGSTNECYDKMDGESEKRTLEFIRKNAKAGKPFFVEYWPNFMNFFKPDMPKKTISGGKVAEGYYRLDAFVGKVMEELKQLGIAENTLFIAMADNGPMVHTPWPGIIKQGQVVGDIIHVTDLYTTFARLGGATKYIPTDRIIDGLDQTALLMKGDTYSRRDSVFIYTGPVLGATVKGRYKRHWIGVGEGAASGAAASFYDLYQDPREETPQFVPLIHTMGQFNRMLFRHELFKKKYPDVPKAHGIPYTGLSNARPETRAIADRVKRDVENMPFDLEEYMKFDWPAIHLDGDWGQ